MLDERFTDTYPWYKRGDYFARCLDENREGGRVTLMAYGGEELAGCCHLLYRSGYPYFRENGIPEINDLNVFPDKRRMGIAGALLDELEAIAARTSRAVGLGVGLYADYGNAQRLYGKRGYVMDGRGLTYANEVVRPGQTVTADDELLLYMIKRL
ncbi:GNAT family N-acetyltransferase [Cohnella cellulosilytica]|uniref:GNAT family N-acetyltransferase n=1 Tax=Cohnella cellulosilytica TaxID=986710 RepID=UPI0035E84402